jgi:hypothetical protein
LSTFTDQDNWYERTANGYLTTDELVWEIGRIGSGLYFFVPVNTPFDVSIPRGLRWLYSPLNPRYLKAAALHDYALASGWDRVSSAALFNDALKANKVGGLERLSMVIGVIIYKWS